VPQERSSAEIQAESETEETRQFVRRVRRVTRRKFSPEEKVRVVLEGFRAEVKVSELCRREGIRPNVYYAWLKDFMEAGKPSAAERTRFYDAAGNEIAFNRGQTWVEVMALGDPLSY
jgi:transposase-like protein